MEGEGAADLGMRRGIGRMGFQSVGGGYVEFR
jgi:hypothetical protein